jgi:hypothetical protein
MSMILLEPANTILYNSLEDQAADHLINGLSETTVFETLDLPKTRLMRTNSFLVERTGDLASNDTTADY